LLRALLTYAAGGVEATIEEQSELEAALEGDEEAAPAAAGGGGGGGGEAGPSDPQAGARWEEEQARKAAASAEEEDVELEELSQQLGGLVSPSKPAGKKQKMGDGSSRGQALEITESQE